MTDSTTTTTIPTEAKRTRLLACFGLATILIVLGMPWPGRPGGRPLFRGL